MLSYDRIASSAHCSSSSSTTSNSSSSSSSMSKCKFASRQQGQRPLLGWWPLAHKKVVSRPLAIARASEEQQEQQQQQPADGTLQGNGHSKSLVQTLVRKGKSGQEEVVPPLDETTQTTAGVLEVCESVIIVQHVSTFLAEAALSWKHTSHVCITACTIE